MGGNATLEAIPSGPTDYIPGVSPRSQARREVGPFAQAVRHDDATAGVAGTIGNLISPILIGSTPVRFKVPSSALAVRILARRIHMEENNVDNNGMSFYNASEMEPCLLFGENLNLGSWNQATRFPNPNLNVATLAVSNPNQVITAAADGPAGTSKQLAIQGPGSGAFPIFQTDKMVEKDCAGMTFFYLLGQGAQFAVFFEFRVLTNS